MEMNTLNSVALSAVNNASNPIGQALGVVMLDKQLEMSETMSDGMVKAMERSVNPSVGGNFDMYA